MEFSPACIDAETITAQLWLVLRGVLAQLGMWRLNAAQMRAVFGRINRVGLGLARLLRRFEAGQLWRVPARAPRDNSGLALAVAVAVRPPALPRRAGWLLEAGSHQAAGFASQLRTLLQTPDFSALLAACPQAVRLLRPLCRSLLVELPEPPRPPRAPRVPKPRCPAPLPFRIPLPRGVLSAVRRRKRC